MAPTTLILRWFFVIRPQWGSAAQPEGDDPKPFIRTQAPEYPLRRFAPLPPGAELHSLVAEFKSGRGIKIPV